MTTPSISIKDTPTVQYLLRIGDTALILGQRLGEWCGHAPVIEEDIALTNMALDLIGQSRALLTRAGQLEGEGQGRVYDEDQLAFLRDERDYRNVTMAELPNGHRRGERPGDFAFTTLRNAMLATWFRLLWQRLATSSDAELAAIAGKAVKEARYHQEHAADWVVRLGDGTDESARRMRAALAELWRYVPELFESDAIDEAAAASGLGPRWSELREPWLAEMQALLAQAQLAVPADSAFRSTAKQGVHTEHMGYILAELQFLQRAYPGGAW
ncbi:MAG: phenylacetate-CoA oxygenase subunit PaaC [Burkholderiaceae bacterium]|nr:phenylacetate-CoA oxygenase subunit PaaC [Burkholderiaceae bacterium]